MEKSISTSETMRDIWTLLCRAITTSRQARSIVRSSRRRCGPILPMRRRVLNACFSAIATWRLLGKDCSGKQPNSTPSMSVLRFPRLFLMSRPRSKIGLNASPKSLLITLERNRMFASSRYFFDPNHSLPLLTKVLDSLVARSVTLNPRPSWRRCANSSSVSDTRTLL